MLNSFGREDLWRVFWVRRVQLFDFVPVGGCVLEQRQRDAAEWRKTCGKEWGDGGVGAGGIFAVRG